MTTAGFEDRVYRIVISDFTVEHFSRQEVEEMNYLLGKVSAVDHQHFYGIWFHVCSQNARTLHLPPQMSENLFPIVGRISNNRRLKALREQLNDNSEGAEGSENPRVEQAVADAE